MMDYDGVIMGYNRNQGLTLGGGEGSFAPPPKIFQVFSPLKTWFSFLMSILYVPIY